MELFAPQLSVEDIFKNFCGRRSGIVDALTVDADDFYALCDPEKENLCLYGHADHTWEVTTPADDVPPDLPEPVLGINFSRDGMDRRGWIGLVAYHSDSWLLSVAFYLASRCDAVQRKRLFTMINDLPTVFEVVHEKDRKKEWAKFMLSVDYGNKSKPSAERSSESSVDNGNKSKPVAERSSKYSVNTGNKSKPSADRSSESSVDTGNKSKPSAERSSESSVDTGNKSKPSAERSSESQFQGSSKTVDDDYSDGEDEHDENICGSCGGNYKDNEFWIGCDICGKWFHGKCVKITQAKAKIIKQYKCPRCSLKKYRQ